MASLNFAHPEQDAIDPAFAALLGDTAKDFGGLNITSGYRSPEYNRKVGGAKKSQHVHGKAADIDMSDMDEAGRRKLVQSLKQRGATGFITYSDSPNMLHVDMRPGKPHFMFDRSAENIGKAPKWFQEIASGKEQQDMAAGMIEVELPDGTVVEFPEGTPQDVMRKALKKLASASAPEPVSVDPATNQPAGVPEFVPPGVEGYDPQTGEVSKPSSGMDRIGAFLSSAVEGIPIAGPTLKKGVTGVASGIVAGLEGDGAPLDARPIADQMTARSAELERDNPVSSTAGAVTGAVLPMIAVGGTALGARALGVTGNSLKARTLASGSSNALIAGTDTVARGGDAGDVGYTGTLAGAIGLALPGAGAALNGLGRSVRDVVGPRLNALVRPSQEAERRVGTALKTDAANTAAPVINQADEASAALNSQQLLNVDRGGETTRALARSAANSDPEARALIEKTASDRFGSQSDRAQSFIQRITGGATDDVAMKEQLVSASRKANKPAYDRAFGAEAAQDMSSPELLGLLRSPAVRDAAKAAEARGANRAVVEGFETVRNPFTFDGAGAPQLREGIKPTLQFWNQVKINLDSEIGKAQRAGDRALASEMIGLKTKLVSELDKAVPDYAKARQGAAAFFGAEDALDAGKKFVTQNRTIPETRAALAKMSPAERSTFAVGFASELKDAIAQAGDRTNVINKIFGSPQSREKIKLALGPKAYGEFEQFVKVEHSMDMIRSAMGNSTTARQLWEMGLAGGTVGTGTALFTGDWKSGVGAAVLTGLAKRGGAKIDQKITKRVAELLLADDPAALQKAITLASNSPKAAAAVEAIQSALSSAIKGLGTVETRPERQPLEITVGRPAN